MTNKEIKAVCIDQQRKRGSQYPEWKFNITQSKNKVNIFWEYIDETMKISPWTIEIEDDFFFVRNEHGELMNDELEDTLDLESTIRSSVYYMNTRY